MNNIKHFSALKQFEIKAEINKELIRRWVLVHLYTHAEAENQVYWHINQLSMKQDRSIYAQQEIKCALLKTGYNEDAAKGIKVKLHGYV